MPETGPAAIRLRIIAVAAVMAVVAIPLFLAAPGPLLFVSPKSSHVS